MSRSNEAEERRRPTKKARLAPNADGASTSSIRGTKAAPSYAGLWSKLKLQRPLSTWMQTYIQEDLGFEQMTPVQAGVIPLFLSHKDVIVEAITGSGKTLAYLVPLIEMLTRKWEKEHDERFGSLKQIRGEDQHNFSNPKQRRRTRQLGAVVISPTRELAAQIHEVLSSFLRVQPSQLEEDEWENELEARVESKIAASSNNPKEQLTRKEALALIEKEDDQSGRSLLEGLSGPAPLRAQLVVGGSASKPQKDYQRFKEDQPDILIGTPGRLEELLKKVQTKSVEILIMDEADRLLDLGFLPTLTSILDCLPRQRRTGLFSATMTDAMTELARLGLRNPSRIVVKVEKKVARGDGRVARELVTEDRRTPVTLHNLYLACRPENKLAQLVRLLRYEKQSSAQVAGGSSSLGPSGAAKMIVYFATCAQVNYFYKILSQAGILPNVQVHSLHGKQTPARRRATFQSFVSAISVPSSDSATLLLCTDVAARGLDLPDVDCVIQYDPPTDPSSFHHRIGRTARAGRKGRAIVLLHKGREEEYIEFMQLRKVPFQAYPYLTYAAEVDQIKEGEEPAMEDAEARRLEDKVREVVKTDRQIYDLGAIAFVSFVRAYSKHEAAYIFRTKDLDLEAMARSYGLLRIPKMPERKAAASVGNDAIAAASDPKVPHIGFQDADIDMDSYAYLDPAKERHRQEKKAKRAEAAAAAAVEGAHNAIDTTTKKGSAGVREEAWSVQKQKKETKEVRREKKEKKRKWLQEEEKKAKQKGDDDEHEDDDDEVDWKDEEREEKRRRKALKAAKDAAIQVERPDADGHPSNGPDGGVTETGVEGDFFGDL